MNETVRKLILKALIGFVCGIVIGAVFVVLAGRTGVYLANPGKAAVRLICCGLYGTGCLGGTVMYRMDQMSILLATIIHYIIVMAGLFLLGLSFNWNFSSGWVWSIFASYTAGFFMTWYISYLKGKKKARQMNENLKKWKEAQKKAGLKTERNSI